MGMAVEQSQEKTSDSDREVVEEMKCMVCYVG